MGKKTKYFILFLFTWALGASYLALQSPAGLQTKEFVNALISGNSSDVPYQEGYSFILSTVKSYYNLSTDTSISDKEVFLTSYFSRRISSALREDYIATANRAKRGKLKREFSIDQILFDLKKKQYVVSVRVTQEDEDFGNQKFFIKLSIALRKSFEGTGEYQVFIWDEVPTEKPFEGYMNKEFFAQSEQTSRIAFPCETNSLLAKNSVKGVDSKLFKNGSLIEFSFKENIDQPATYTMKCGKRKFQSRFSPATNHLTLYRKVAMSEGKLPPKPKTDMEKALEGLKGWKN